MVAVEQAGLTAGSVVIFVFSAPDLYGILIILGLVPSRIYMQLVATSWSCRSLVR